MNSDLILDAGTIEETRTLRFRNVYYERRILHFSDSCLRTYIPSLTRQKVPPPHRYLVMASQRLHLILRWGSYLAVLLDRSKPVWSETNSGAASRISDEEMARINIEASAAVEEWIDLYRNDRGGQL